MARPVVEDAMVESGPSLSLMFIEIRKTSETSIRTPGIELPYKSIFLQDRNRFSPKSIIQRESMFFVLLPYLPFLLK